MVFGALVAIWLITEQYGNSVMNVTLLAGKPFSEADRERLVVAVERIQAAMTACGVSPC